MELLGSRIKGLAVDAEGEQCVAGTQFFEDVASGGQWLWSEVMTGLRGK
jgi:hypothetical protein